MDPFQPFEYSYFDLVLQLLTQGLLILGELLRHRHKQLDTGAGTGFGLRSTERNEKR